MFFRKTKIHRRYRNAKRYQQIVGVLIKHGFYEFVYNSNLLHFANFKKRFFPGKSDRAGIPESHISRSERIRYVLEELGPAFVKLGQFLSNRTDIIPRELCTELEKLLDQVAPFDKTEALKTLEREFGKPHDQIFSDFNMVPISSASISQVHEAHLKSGEKVAVKIQRPHVRGIIESDLEIMMHMASLMERFVDGMSELHPAEIIEDFKNEITNELDFTQEAANIEKFRLMFEKDKHVYFPKVYREFTTTKVLTMEFIDGVKFSRIVSDPAGHPDSNIKLITDNLAQIVLRQVFEFGFFHGDPHPGNILIQEGSRICMIDLGFAGIIHPKMKEALSEIIVGIVKHDPERVTTAILAISQNHDTASRERLEYSVFKMIEQYAYLPLCDINIGAVLGETIKIVLDNKLRIPPDLYLLLKALIALEGAIRKIRPDFNMFEHVEPFVKKLVFDSMGPVAIVKSLFKSGAKYTKLIQDIPESVREIIDQLKNRNIKIQFEHKGLEPMLHKHDQISNRISYAIITASMLICSALILHAGIPPKLYQISIIGIITFFFALMMGSFLLISILRHGKM